MPSSNAPSRVHALSLLGFAALLAVCSATPTASQSTWSVDPQFGKSEDARMNISGAACAKTTPPFQSCLAINDEKKYAQFFAINGTKTVPGCTVRLLGDDADHDPDAEAAAYDDGFFYVIGSHGQSRHHPGRLRDESFLVFRFEVNRQTGKPAFDSCDDKFNPAVKSSAKLRDAIKIAPKIGPFAEKALIAERGVNIEGIAVKDKRMYLGFRAPSIDGKGFIMSVAVNGVFGADALDANVIELSLGTDTGIRDLAGVDGGLLVLAGPMRDEAVPYAVFHWDEARGARKLMNLDMSGIPADAKAETLLVLEEQSQSYRALIMFDGIENGGPREISVPKLQN
jgi:hypothetical protein